MSEIIQPFVLLSQLSLVVLVGTWLFFSHRNNNKIKEQRLADDKKLNSRLMEIEGQIRLLSQTIIPISTAFQAVLVKELTHPHAPEFDELLWKVGTFVPLNDDEQNRLSELLKIRANDFSDSVLQSERDAASILPAVIRRTAIEQAALAAGQGIKANRVPLSPTADEPNQKNDI